MLNIGIILGSTRQGRRGETPFQWVVRMAQKEFEGKAQIISIDLREWNLPHFDDPKLPSTGEYSFEYTKRWSAAIAPIDGFIIVTPEYTHGYPGVLKDALDHLYNEWVGKPVGFVGYGGVSGGIRALEQLKPVVLELQLKPIGPDVPIPAIWSAFDEQGNPKEPKLETKLKAMLSELVRMAEALKPLRK